MMVTTPLNERERNILALRGQPVPGRSDYVFGEDVVFENGKYQLQIFRRQEARDND